MGAATLYASIEVSYPIASLVQVNGLVLATYGLCFAMHAADIRTQCVSTVFHSTYIPAGSYITSRNTTQACCM